MTIERWLPVVGFEEFYSVSDLGRVRVCARPGHQEKVISLRRRIRHKQGALVYLQADFYLGEKRYHKFVHVLVLEAFVCPRPEGLQCRHLNGDPLDNRLCNLAWGTQKENSQDQIRHGTTLRGERHPCTKLKEADVLRIRELSKAGIRPRELGVMFGTSTHSIRDIVTGSTWKHLASEQT